ncbi:MAG: DNA replication and repair protein RecF [Alistipes sp.]|jgi:DNA replication and repair protein RecF|nr:DNA replication and repair protein RecF [Alistipes sp.]
MILRRLSLVGFRNITPGTLEFSSGLNCLVGDNGAGKTNILDAVHYLSMCRSSLGGTDRQALGHGCAMFVVEGEYTADAGHTLKVACSFSPTGAGATKKMRCGGKEYERLSEHVGVVPIVMVSPADTFLISDAADERRRWLNSFISQSDRAYLQSLVRYNAVLTERNRLLRGADGSLSGSAAEILDVLDMQLAEHGERIHACRAEIVERMRPLVADYYAHLADDRERVEMIYRSEVTERGMAAVLAAGRAKDIASGFTTGGVHRDEVVMRIGGDPLRRYGSQGQQKSFLIALKLAQFAVVSGVTGERPILLLDDLFDKLDTGRVERLIKLVSGGGFSQIFISDCNRERLEGVLRRGGRDYSLFDIKNGEVSAPDETANMSNEEAPGS